MGLTEAEVRSAETGFNRAMAARDTEYLERHVHENFVWVHDHARAIHRFRDDLLDMIRNNPISVTSVRSEEDVSIVVFGQTALVYGFTNIERTGEFAAKSGRPSKLKFHFMRTYVKGSGAIQLVGNQTMEVWRED